MIKLALVALAISMAALQLHELLESLSRLLF
jgi:hypothetical protein